MIVGALILMWLISAGGLLRVVWINSYRNRLQQKIDEAIKVDAEKGMYGFVDWRYGMLKAVKQEMMLLRFWRRLSSFYPDLSFTEPLPEHVVLAYRTLEASTGRCVCTSLPDDAYTDCPTHGVVFGPEAIKVYPTRYSCAAELGAIK